MSKLSNIIWAVFEVDPLAEAIEFNGSWVSWGQLHKVGKSLDALLRAAGLNEGARVGMVMRSQPDIVAAIIGTICNERCIVTLNSMLPDDKLANDIAELKPPVVLAQKEDWARPGVKEAAQAIGCLGLQFSGEAMNPVEVVPGLETISGEELRFTAPGTAIEMLTSGTTGTPKRVPLSFRTVETGVLGAAVFEKRSVDEPVKLRGGTQILHTPFAHISGIFGLLNCIVAGRRACLLERFTVENFVSAVRKHKPVVAGAPPSALRMMLDADVPKEHLSSLKVFRTGTAPLDPDLADAFFEHFGIPVLQNYGATEFAGGVAGWTVEDHNLYHKTKRGSVGRMNPECEARIVHPDTGALLSPGEEGVLELFASHLGDGKSWIRTTDLARLDSDKFLWILGRLDNAIIRGGFKIFPDDVVRAMEAHPAILEAAVVALPDPRLGQVPVAAFIVRKGMQGPSESALKAYLKDRLLPYQVPVKFLEVESMPRTPSMKVSQPGLREIFAVLAT